MTNFCALHPQISRKNAEFPYLHLRNPPHLRIKQMPCQFCPVVCLVHNRTFLPGLGKNCTANLAGHGQNPRNPPHLRIKMAVRMDQKDFALFQLKRVSGQLNVVLHHHNDALLQLNVVLEHLTMVLPKNKVFPSQLNVVLLQNTFILFQLNLVLKQLKMLLPQNKVFPSKQCCFAPSHCSFGTAQSDSVTAQSCFATDQNDYWQF
jgi:hypothetical protein